MYYVKAGTGGGSREMGVIFPSQIAKARVILAPSHLERIKMIGTPRNQLVSEPSS